MSLRPLVVVALVVLVACSRQNPGALVWKEHHAALAERLSNASASLAVLSVAAKEAHDDKTPAAVAEAARMQTLVAEAEAAKASATTLLAATDREMQDVMSSADPKVQETKLAESRAAVSGSIEALETKLESLTQSLEAYDLVAGRKTREESLVVTPVDVDATKAGETSLTELDFDDAGAVDTTARSTESVAALVKALKACPGIVVKLEVHVAKDQLDAAQALAVTTKRAEALKQVLVTAQQVPAKRIASVTGFGFDRPVVPAVERPTPMQLAAARSQNDRVVVNVVTPCPSSSPK